jgi:hypothetical protein
MKPQKMVKVKKASKPKKAKLKPNTGPSWQQVSNHQNAGLDVILERLDEIKEFLVLSMGEPRKQMGPDDGQKVSESEMPEAPPAAA